MSRLLLVDDDADACELLSLFLTRRGFEVHARGTLAEGSRALEDERYDGLLVDLELPDGNGRMLLAGGRPKSLRAAVIVSGRASDEERKESLAAGFDAHLVKPIDRGQLLSVLSRVAPEAPRPP